MQKTCLFGYYMDCMIDVYARFIILVILSKTTSQNQLIHWCVIEVLSLQLRYTTSMVIACKIVQ